LSKTETKELAAAKAGMDVKTARKYLADGRLPRETKPERNWRTRGDPFERVWDEIREQNGQLILGGGIYFDKLRRVGDGWKFTERHAFSTYWITLIEKVDEQALATRILLAERPKLVRV